MKHHYQFMPNNAIPFWPMDKVRLKGPFAECQYGAETDYGENPNMPEMQFIGAVMNNDEHNGSRPKYHPDWPFESRTFYRIYRDLDNMCGYPTYDIDVTENQIELVERGNIWRYCNNEPLTGGIWEEARALMLLGMFNRVPPPKEGKYSDYNMWSKENLIKGLGSLQIHGIECNRLYLLEYKGDCAYYAVRLDDENIGKRAAEATLESILMDNSVGYMTF